MKFIDLFAGIGGLSLPFHELGFECVFASEINLSARKTYQTNFHQPHIIHGDITQILNEDIPSHDLLLAGFPCQPFSQAGQKKGFADERGQMFFEIERILCYHRPTCFLLENVPRLLTHNQKQTFQVIESHLLNLNYHLFYQVLNAYDYGSIQRRKRLFIVGFAKEKFGDTLSFQFPEPYPKHLRPSCLQEILETLPENHPYTLSDTLFQYLQRHKAKHQSQTKKTGFGYQLLNASSQIVPTIPARYYKDGKECLIEQENKNPRKLTPREIARLQCFPETFILSPSINQAYQQLGNSVCVNVVKEIAYQMLKTIETKLYLHHNKI